VKEVDEHVEHRRVVSREPCRPAKWHLGAKLRGDCRNLLIVGADDEAREPRARPGGVDRVGDERPARKRREILARNPFRSAPRRNYAKNVQY
jgi:hypothetical protein